MATEVKEEVVLIAKRRPPGDQWVLLLDPNHIYPSLTDALEGYFEAVGGLAMCVGCQKTALERLEVYLVYVSLLKRKKV